MSKFLLEGIKILAPTATAFAALNAALPRPTVYVRTRVSQSQFDRCRETDPRLELIFGNVGAGVMIPESFEWIADGMPVSSICDVIHDCRIGAVEGIHSRKVYINKPFEAHARLHLVTFRPQRTSDRQFHERILKQLSQRRVCARVSFRYFHSKWGPRTTRDIPLISD